MKAEEIMLLLSRLGEILTPAATQVWEIYMRQVILQARVNLAIGIGCLGIAWPLFYLGAKMKCKDDYSMWEGPLILGICAIPVGVFRIVLGYMELSNPAYYTLKAIAALLP